MRNLPLSSRSHPIGRPAASLTTLLMALLVSRAAAAQHRHPAHDSTIAPAGGFGTIVFANSGAQKAQEPFLRGVALLHSFEVEAARAAFQEAQRADPSFALAHWGEAMTYKTAFSRYVDTATARQALADLGATPRARAAVARTPRERMYLAAAESLFASSASDSVRLARYRDVMRALHEAYPDDDEAAMFHALTFLDDAYDSDLPKQDQLRARVEGAALAEGVFARNPNHPGAAHYLIHFYDHPSLGPLGLRPARAYAAVAPQSGHAQHMPSHIFARYGVWDELIASNLKANQAARTLAQTRKDAPLLDHYDFHALNWLAYAYVQQGRLREAKAVTDTFRRVITPETVARLPEGQRSWWPSFRLFQEAFYAVTAAELDYPARISWSVFRDPFACLSQVQRAMTWTRLEVERATRRNDAAALDSIAASVAALADTVTFSGPAAEYQDDMRQRLGVRAKSIRARAEVARGNPDAAAATLRSAIADEEQELGEGEAAMAFFPPLREELAQLLLASGKADEALREYDVLTNQYRGYWSAMLGRGRALAALGRTEEARMAYTRLLQSWQHADSNHPHLAEVKELAGARE